MEGNKSVRTCLWIDFDCFWEDLKGRKGEKEREREKDVDGDEDGDGDVVKMGDGRWEMAETKGKGCVIGMR